MQKTRLLAQLADIESWIREKPDIDVRQELMDLIEIIREIIFAAE